MREIGVRIDAVELAVTTFEDVGLHAAHGVTLLLRIDVVIMRPRALPKWHESSACLLIARQVVT
jgi:hypothetical protein